MTTRITIEARMADDRVVEEFLTMIKQFNDDHPDDLFRLAGIAGDTTVEQMKRIFERVGLTHIYESLKQ
jgi:hypothetical protein